jgi:hypothetical protein
LEAPRGWFVEDPSWERARRKMRAAEGATAPETLRQKDRERDKTVWIAEQSLSPKG